MSEQSSRYYASEQYLLPADEAETQRLNKQHAVIVKAFENRLSLAPIDLKTGDRVLENAAGSGIWALEFFEEKFANGVTINMECTDISPKQFPTQHPSQMHFSINSVTNLPPGWTNMFSYIHQRLLVLALNDSLWRSTVAELFRVVQPGGWIELLEPEVACLRWGVGPHSKKVCALVETMNAKKGLIGDLSVYLPILLKDAGFVNVHCVTRHAYIGGESIGFDNNGYSSEEWRDLWMATKGHVVEGGGFGIVESGEEYQALMEDAMLEWTKSKEAHTTFYTILARKPC